MVDEPDPTPTSTIDRFAVLTTHRAPAASGTTAAFAARGRPTGATPPNVANTLPNSATAQGTLTPDVWRAGACR